MHAMHVAAMQAMQYNMIKGRTKAAMYGASIKLGSDRQQHIKKSFLEIWLALDNTATESEIASCWNLMTR